MRNSDMPANPSGLIQKRRVNPNDPGSDFAVMSSSEPKHKGLTKREYFAGLAMQGLLSGPHADADCGIEGLAHDAALAADELLKALERTK